MDDGIYEHGDKVKIVDRWNGKYHNHAGDMDEWLGEIMTIDKFIRRIDGQNIYRCVEDHGRWSWYDEMFDDSFHGTIPYLENSEKEAIMEMLI